MKQSLIDLYLDYVNNYLTAVRLAEDLGMSVEATVKILYIGKELHEENVKLLKETGK